MDLTRLAELLFGLQLLSLVGNVEAVIPDPTCEYVPRSVVYDSIDGGLLILREDEPLIVPAEHVLPARSRAETQYQVCGAGLRPPFVYVPAGARQRELPQLNF